MSEKFIENLKRLMQNKKINQAQLAENVGVSQSFISYMMHGYKKPSVELLCRIARELDCTTDELLGR